MTCSKIFHKVEEFVQHVEKKGNTELIILCVMNNGDFIRVLCHEVVIRPLEDGGFVYVLNYVILSEDNAVPIWYTDRLTEEEWKEFFRYVTCNNS